MVFVHGPNKSKIAFLDIYLIHQYTNYGIKFLFSHSFKYSVYSYTWRRLKTSNSFVIHVVQKLSRVTMGLLSDLWRKRLLVATTTLDVSTRVIAFRREMIAGRREIYIFKWIMWYRLHKQLNTLLTPFRRRHKRGASAHSTPTSTINVNSTHNNYHIHIKKIRKQPSINTTRIFLRFESKNDKKL